MKPSRKHEPLRREIEDSLRLTRWLLQEQVLETLLEISGRMRRALAAGRKVLLCGNGGSSADCQHWSGEMVGRYARERRACPFVCLTGNDSVLTSIANDSDFSRVFSRQVEAFGKPGDILVCLSTSGRSANILEAARTAVRRKMTVISLTGRLPNPLQRISDLCFSVPSANTPRIQEIHIQCIHLLCGIIEESLPR